MRLSLPLCALLCLTMAVHVESAEVGIDIGAPAPDFTLTDQDGQSHSLSELVKQGKVALVFYRSAEW